jgi:hypothetical protein
MNPELTILRNLERGHEGIVTKPVLWNEVSLDDSGVTYSEFSKALGDLEIEGEVLVLTGKDRIKVKITDKGKLRLMEA